MSRVQMFENKLQYALEQKINEFIKDKKVISISYSTSLVGYYVYHYACVVYEV